MSVRALVGLSAALAVLNAACVGYDGSSDGASVSAASLGITADEEQRIRGALGAKALTAEQLELQERLATGRAITVEQLDAFKAEVEKWEKLPPESRPMDLSFFGASRLGFEGMRCAADINCLSKHCDQSGVCVGKDRFASDGVNCYANADCQSNRCDGASRATSTMGRCGSRSTDLDGQLWGGAPNPLASPNAGETDLDCGGDESPHTCALFERCKEDDDCAVGNCVQVVESRWFGRETKKNVCVLVGANVTDLGGPWAKTPKSAPAARAPYSREIRVPAERSAVDQKAFVNGRPALRDSLNRSVAAEQARSFQHRTCTEHLLANGCSPAVHRSRMHREAYDFFLCPRQSKGSIGISKFENLGQRGEAVFPDRWSRTWKGLEEDPYLCNHSFTGGVRVLSKSPRQYASDSRSGNVGSPVDAGTVYWDGLLISKQPEFNPLLWTNVRTWLDPLFALRWADELQRALLIGAACNTGSVFVGDRRLINKNPTLYGRDDDPRIAQICSKWRVWWKEPSLGYDPTSLGSRVADFVSNVFISLSADERNFIMENVPHWGEFDIYAIDPEGNPYKPANKNMQYGWDAMNPGQTFDAYVLGYSAVSRNSAKVTKTSTSYPYDGQLHSVYGVTQANGSVTAFMWGP